MKQLLFLCLVISASISIAQTKTDSLLLFVGKKITITKAKEQTFHADTIVDAKGNKLIKAVEQLDTKYLCVYKVLKAVNGACNIDTIRFYAYTHFRELPFVRLDTVLMVVNISEIKNFQPQYHYYRTCLTQNNRWAVPYDVYNDSLAFSAPPQKLNFKNPPSFKVHNLSPPDLKKYYPQPYFQIKNKEAIALYGNYVEQVMLKP